MSSITSEENKSSSMTSESEQQLLRKKIKEFKYPKIPKRNRELRENNQTNLTISSNLFELKFRYDNYKFTLFSINILPEVSDDNYPLMRIIYSKIEIYLPKCFKKTFWAGKNMFAIIAEKEGENYEKFEIKVELDKIQYNLIFEKVKEISFKKVDDFSGNNQKIKSIIENLIRNIIMKNPKIIKFHDRTIFEIDKENIKNIQNNQYFYCGYITSVNITESGLYMLVNNVNKLITGKTVLKKMIELRSKLKGENMELKDIYREIKDYCKYHKTVLTMYGSLRTYKILDIDFDKNPVNTTMSYKDIDGLQKTISLINYYKMQYQIEIKEKNQPLIIAENNFIKNQKSLQTNSQNSLSSKYSSYNIYLIPELVYITGLEENNNKERRRNLITSGIKNPNEKMKKIKGIYKLIESTNSKQIKNKKGERINLKSPKELSEEWGINLGSNLIFQGTIFPQPKLYFRIHNVDKVDKQEIIEPTEGRFRPGNPYQSCQITTTNIFYVFDKKDNNNYRQLFGNLMNIFRDKGFVFSNDFHPYKVKGYALENTNNWENIKRSLSIIENNGNKFGIIFCNKRLEGFYKELKYFFLVELNIPTQHVITKKLLDGKKSKSIMCNLVDQINIKAGGENFYIDFKNENLIKSGQVFLIIGLDSKRIKGMVNYSMTSSKNFRLNKFYTQEYICEDKIQIKNSTLKMMFTEALEQLMKKSPHCPDYIIIYRQGGNDVHNKFLAVNEIDNFKEVLKEYREKVGRIDNNPSKNFKNTRLYYICCNLKSDLKFFETNKNNINQPEYKNPNSGLVVDEKVIQSNKFEFYLQPQYVNQGSATPCHYSVMYYDKSEKEEDNLKLENLEKISFYLSFYYWTWSGAIRVPSLLKMSTTAMDFYSRIYNVSNCFFEHPTYI